MKQSRIPWSAFGVFAILVAAPAISRADRITIRDNSVIPITIDDSLSLSKNRSGDRFTAHVNNDRDLPNSVRLNGRVVGIHRARDNQPGYMDLEFTDLVTPDGDRVRVRAVPIPWNDRNVRRDRDGRFTATDNVHKREADVIGGTLGGLVIGSLIRKPFEGAILGAIAGVVLSENDRKNGNDVVVARGAKMGALVERSFTVDLDDRYGSSRPNWREGDRDGDYRDRDRNDGWQSDRDRDRDWNDRSDSIRIAYDDRDLRFSGRERPYRAGNSIMVPLYRTADQLDLRIRRGEQGVFFVEDDDRTVRLEQDSRDYRLNGRRGSMSRALIDRDGVLYVPLEVFAKVKRESISVNGNRIDSEAY